MLRQEEVRASGLEWTVVESIPVHEAVKRGRPSDKVRRWSQIERNHDSCLLALSKNGHNSDHEISLPGEEFSAVHFEKKSLSEGSVTTARSYSSQIFQLLRTGETTLDCRCYS